MVYLPEREAEIQTLLGSNWDQDLNRQNALALAQSAATQDPTDAFAWFNVGSNLVYFERYDEANAAYDKAREIGLPQRMFRFTTFARLDNRKSGDLHGQCLGDRKPTHARANHSGRKIQ